MSFHEEVGRDDIARSMRLRSDALLRANEPLHVDAILRRFVDREACWLEPAPRPGDNFRDATPSGEIV